MGNRWYGMERGAGSGCFADGAARPGTAADAAALHYCVAGGLLITARYRLKLGEYVNPGTLVAHVGSGGAHPLPGEVLELTTGTGSWRPRSVRWRR